MLWWPKLRLDDASAQCSRVGKGVLRTEKILSGFPNYHFFGNWDKKEHYCHCTKVFYSLMCKIATSAQRSRSNADMAAIDVFKLCFTMTHSRILLSSSNQYITVKLWGLWKSFWTLKQYVYSVPSTEKLGAVMSFWSCIFFKLCVPWSHMEHEYTHLYRRIKEPD